MSASAKVDTGTPSRWAVICPVHGRCYLTEAQYEFQMDRTGRPWVCVAVAFDPPDDIGPCGRRAEFDDETYDAADQGGAW